jgi:hypothetical protein
MPPEIKNYLNDIRSQLHLDPHTERQIISELYNYFNEKISELRTRGLSEIEAAREAISACGRPRVIARMWYEACSRGSWGEACMSALPHVLIAALFFSHMWNNKVIGPAMFLFIVAVTLTGWRRGKPCWIYPWIGYSFLPMIIAIFSSGDVYKQILLFIQTGEGPLPQAWIIATVVLLFVATLWIIIGTTIKVVRRDWILASMMLVPLPVISSWLFNIEQAGGLFQAHTAALYEWDISMGILLLVLGGSSAVFIRLRQRALKIIAILTMGAIGAMVVAGNFLPHLGFLGLLISLVVSLLALISPILIEARIGHGEVNNDALLSDVITSKS